MIKKLLPVSFLILFIGSTSKTIGATLETTHDILTLQATTAAIGSDSTIVSGSAPLSLFDPSLGVLNSFTFSFDLHNFALSGFAETFRPFTTLSHRASSTFLLGIPIFGVSNVLQGALSDSGFCSTQLTLSTSCSITLDDSIAPGTESTTVFAPLPASLAGIIGVGTFDLEYVLSLSHSTTERQTILNNTLVNDAPGSAQVEWSGTTRITYDYTPFNQISEIPIPAALWLFGTALIGFVGYSRRRKIG